jgi:CheY-like chemotaxis protein
MPRVLIVEDNELNRDMLSRRLMRRGWEVSIAEDGLKGVQAAQRDCPDVILMDLSLPVVSGWDATRRIKEIPRFSSTPIVALSAHAMMEDKASAEAAGCDEFATKPVQFEQLITTMNALIEERDRRGH